LLGWLEHELEDIEDACMIVITRNGKTEVYTGWREWLLLGAGLAVCWLVLGLIVVFVIGVALSVGVILLLVVPAAVAVAVVKGMMRS
jgi:hypothetical protein